MNASGNTTSVWMEERTALSFPRLEHDTDCEVCVIGAGIAGLTTAYMLAEAGKKVLVIEKFPQVSEGETSRTTAQLTFFTDFPYSQLKRMHGDNVLLIAESHRHAIETIRRIAQQERIECDFRSVPVYLFAPGEKDVDQLDKEAEILKEINVKALRHERLPTEGLPPYPCLEIPGLAQMHALKYMYGLAAAVERLGVRIHADTKAEKIEKAGDFVLVKTADGVNIRCRDLVTATNSPVSVLTGVHLKQAAYRSYVVGLRVEKGALPYAIWWDTLDPYHYVRLVEFPDHDVLIAGGEDHHTGREDGEHEDTDRFRCLEDWTRETFPQCGELLFEWSGQIMESVDGIGYNGRHLTDKHIYVITGDSGSGTTNGTLGARIVTDLILGRENPWEALYSPARVNLRAADYLVKEGAAAFWQFKDYVTPGDVSDESAIAPGSGALVREGLSKVALYKDETGRLFRMSPVCPHVGCVVHWNDVEKSWDCPCHGSRFDCYGKVLNGPARSDLERLGPEE